MALEHLIAGHTFAFSATVGILAVLTSLIFYLFRKTSFPKNAPELCTEAYPLLGAYHFFTERWEFWKRARAHSKTGSFTFHAGQWPVVGLSGLEERKVFFEHRGLAFAEGYSALLGGVPEVRKDNSVMGEKAEDDDFNAFFRKGLTELTKIQHLRRGLPKLISDARNMLDDLAKDGTGMTRPFDSIYRMVFQFTMRTVACDEIGDDPALVSKFLKNFELIDEAGTPLSVMFPWMPLPSKLKRLYAGAQLYLIIKKIIDEREKTGIKNDDALQWLIDQGKTIVS